MNAAKKTARPKPLALADALAHVALSLGAGSRLPGVRELCARHGVARETVSEALALLEARGVITRRQGSGIFVAPTAGLRTIGLAFGSNVFDSCVAPVYRMLLERCAAKAADGHSLFRFYIDMPAAGPGRSPFSAHAELLSDVRCGRVNGMIFTYDGTKQQRQWHRSLEIPLVYYIPTGRTNDSVGIDYGAIVRQGVSALASGGRRRIALITVLGYLRNEGFDEDIAAYRDALRDAGLEWERVWEHLPDGSTPRTEATAKLWEARGREAVAALFSASPRPDGLVVTDDMACRGVLAELEARGLKAGRTLGIATHYTQGSDSLNGNLPGLIRLEVEPVAIIDALFKNLEFRMDGGGSAAPFLVKPTVSTQTTPTKKARK